MTIIVFLIDTSASMYQRTYVGGRTTLLDVAKSAVETFVKIRQRSPESRIDRYMLLTFEEPPNNIKAGWKENLSTFMNELKNLQCNSMTTMGVAVKQAFDILNINRMTSGIDTYGQGRCPFYLETAVIVLITDGGKLSTEKGVHEDFVLPMNQIPGSELTREPFRWDQRLFSLVLRLAGTPATERDTGLVPSDCSPIDPMCEVTGGRSYSIISHRMLNQCIDSLVQKVQNGVVINFEKFGPDPPLLDKTDVDPFANVDAGSQEYDPLTFEPRNVNQPVNTSWHSCRRMIYVPRGTQKSFPVGNWPIPEPFWPEVTFSVLPGRSAHPNVKFSCNNSDPMAIENLPFDKYELEPSPLTQFILARKQPTVCWQVFVANSYKNSEVGHPFGYLKASTNLTCVNLFVMPYNYPVLLPLLDELTKVHRWKPTTEWRAQFQNYMRTLPAYYATPLKKALLKMGTPNVLVTSLIPDTNENTLSFTVMNYLKRLKNIAKIEQEKMCADIVQRQLTVKSQFNIPEQIRMILRPCIKRELVANPMLAEKFNQLHDMITEHKVPYVPPVDRERQTISYRNPFDIPRNRLMAHIVKMRNNLLQSECAMVDEDSTHSLPISQMGNYQEYLKRQTPQLREIESAPVRQHMFGNPFKIDKRMMVDEADIDLVGASGGSSPVRAPKRSSSTPITDIASRTPQKRKPGPLPRDLIVRRPSSSSSAPSSPTTSPYSTPIASPVSSPASSPVPWLNIVEPDPLPPVSNPFAAAVIVSAPLAIPPVAPVGIPNGYVDACRPRSPSPPPLMSHYMFNVVAPTPFYAPVSAASPSTYSTNSNDSCVVEEEPPKHNVFMPSILPVQHQVLREACAPNVNGVLPEIKPAAVKVEDLHEIESANIEIRRTLNRLVRRPGKNHTELFENIKTIQGTAEIKIAVVKLVITESLRFKRKQLALQLEDYVNNIPLTENK